MADAPPRYSSTVSSRRCSVSATGALEDELEHLGLAETRLVQSLAIGDVADVADDPADRVLVELVRARGVEPPPRAVGVADAYLEPLGDVGLGHQTTERAGGGFHVARVHEADDALDDLGRAVAEDHADRRGRAGDHAGAVDHDDRAGRVLHQGVETRLALGDLLACPAGLGHQPGDAPGDQRRGGGHDRGQRDRAVTLGALDDHDRGAENIAVASTRMRARPVRTSPAPRVPELAHRRMEHRGRKQRVCDRPERVERCTVDVRAVGNGARRRCRRPASPPTRRTTAAPT